MVHVDKGILHVRCKTNGSGFRSEIRDLLYTTILKGNRQITRRFWSKVFRRVLMLSQLGG